MQTTDTGSCIGREDSCNGCEIRWRSRMVDVSREFIRGPFILPVEFCEAEFPDWMPIKGRILILDDGIVAVNSGRSVIVRNRECKDLAVQLLPAFSFQDLRLIKPGTNTHLIVHLPKRPIKQVTVTHAWRMRLTRFSQKPHCRTYQVTLPGIIIPARIDTAFQCVRADFEQYLLLTITANVTGIRNEAIPPKILGWKRVTRNRKLVDCSAGTCDGWCWSCRSCSTADATRSQGGGM